MVRSRDFEEILDVLQSFLLGDRIGLRDIGHDTERQLVRPHLMAVMRRALAQLVVQFACSRRA